MRYYLLLFIFLCCKSSIAQQYHEPLAMPTMVDYIKSASDNDSSIRKIDLKEYKNDSLLAYFDYFWGTCVPQLSTYYTVAFKTGNVYQCFDYYSKNNQLCRRGFFLDRELSKPVGSFKIFYPNGQVQWIGYYKDGKKSGKWESYDANGNPLETAQYKDNYRIGSFLKIDEKDTLRGNLDSLGRGIIYVTNAGGKPAYKGKYGLHGQADSTWNQYDDRNKIWYTDYYHSGKLMKSTCFDTSGNPLSDCISRMATYKNGDKLSVRYLSSHIHFPPYLRLTIPNGRVIVSFIVDTNGNIGGIKILQHLQKAFDKAVVNTLKHMPRWQPAMNHGRKVTSYFTLPVDFTNE